MNEPMFWVRLCGDGLYEGPHHHKSAEGKMLRDEKPGEWRPLFLATPQAEPAVAEQAREAFKTWMVANKRWISLAEYPSGKFVHTPTELMAEAWIASRVGLASQSTPPPEGAAPVAVEAGREPTDAQIIEIAETMGKRVPGVSDYEVWGANYYRADSEGNYTIPSVPRLAVHFARRVLSLAAILAANRTAQPPVASVASPDPVAWTLTETLKEAQTTTCGYLWFNNPRNSNWTPLYAAPIAPSPPTPPPESAGQGLHYPAENLLSALVMQTAYDKWSDKPTPSDYVRTGWVAAILAANPTAQPDGGSKA